MEPSVTFADVERAQERLQGVVRQTPLEFCERLSEQFGARIYLKREDLQIVRSYKIRGAYNRMRQVPEAARSRGVVCASAGNHAQGVAYGCKLLQIPGVVFMPRNTPRQKVARVHALGGDLVRIELGGDTFDDAKQAAQMYAETHDLPVIAPFDDPHVVAGQGTVAREAWHQLQAVGETQAPVLVAGVGGGGLLAGMSVYLRYVAPNTEFFAVEPAGAMSLHASIDAGQVVTLPQIETFVDGAAVRSVGVCPFALLAPLYPDCLTPIAVAEGQVCTTMIDLYQNEGIVAEPAGALTVAALPQIAAQFDLRERTVVCVVSGGNNDISRYPEVIERSLIHRGLKHYFLVEFSQRAGALRQYLDEALAPSDDITLFEYVKKNNREFGPALVGVELATPSDLAPLMERMDNIGLRYQKVEPGSPLFRFLV